MREKDIKEGLADLADVAERDHEVQMARAELYKIAKYSIKLHDMLKGVSESAGLEGWVQSKITKASDYMSSVYHHLDYDMKFGEQVQESASDCDHTCPKSCPDCGGTGDPKKFQASKANEAKKSKPDFLDLDGDGNKKEPMKKAAKEKGSKPKKGKVPPQFQKKESYKASIANKLAEELKKKKQRKNGAQNINAP